MYAPRKLDTVNVSIMKASCTYIILLAAIFAIGCGRGADKDSLSKRPPPRSGQALGCTAKCHNSTSTISPDPLRTNGSGTYGKHIAHVQNTGIPCEKCHYNYGNAPTHMNGRVDTPDPAVLIVLFDATNPTGTWINDTGPSTGSCSSLNCHGPDTLEWYGTNTANFQNCGSCHSYVIGTRRRVTGPQGDFGGNASIVSHHVATAGDPIREQCLVCHDQSTHTAGTVRLRNADGGASIAYDPAHASSLEPFCLSCHDANGAAATFISGGSPTAPFSDGSIMGTSPYAYASRIASSWAKSQGHGPNGNHAAGDKLTCLGTGQRGTGCHGNNGVINAHGSMNQVLSARPFTYDNGNTYLASDFALCFDCHSGYPGITKEDILGVKQGGILDWEYSMSPYGGQGPNGFNPPYYISAVQTHFADHNETGSPYNDPAFWGANMNLHWAHIGLLISDFRGTGTITGINCVNCHDVHGSLTPYGALYDEIGYSHVFPDAVNILGQMTDNAYLTDQLDFYPTYCAGFNCHPMMEKTRAWFFPISE